ncbi:hypothetical protein [Pseudoalteromonas piscicida]
MMEVMWSSISVISALVYIGFIFLCIPIPLFIYLISKRVKEMRDLAVESRMEIKEINASLKYFKRKYRESIEEGNT